MFLQKLAHILKPFHRKFKVVLAILVVYEVMALVEPAVVSGMVWIIQAKGTMREVLLYIAVLMVYDEIFNRFDNKVDWVIWIEVLVPVYRHLKESAVRTFLTMEAKWHQSQKSGVLIGKIQSGAERINEVIGNIAWEFAPNTFQAIGTVALLTVLSPIVALILAVSLALFMYLTIRSVNEQMPIRFQKQDAYEDEWDFAQRSALTHETIVSYNQQARFQKEYGVIHDRIIEKSKQEAWIGIYKYGRNRIRIITFSKRVILLILATSAMSGNLSIPALIFSMELVGRLYNSFWRFAKLYEKMMQARVPLERLHNLLSEKPHLTDPVEPRSIDGKVESIEFRDVSLAYGENGNALNKLNLVICGGEAIGVVGPSGAGKTTFRKLLTRLWDPTEGQILVNGVDIRDMSLGDVRGLVAYVAQGGDIDIYDETFATNIAFPNPEASQEVLDWAATVADLYDFITSQPLGWQTKLGEDGLKLSGGQRQRVALARALVANKQVIILDEASSSLDSITERRIQQNIAPHLRDIGRTVIIIAHNLATLQGIVKRIVVLNNGCVVEEGTHEDLLRKGGLYCHMWETQRSEATLVLE